MIIIGVDVGKAGAITVNIGGKIKIYDMPTIKVKDKDEVDRSGVRDIVAHLSTLKDIRAFVERQRPNFVPPDKQSNRGGASSTSVFNSGRYYEMILSILTCYGIPIEMVEPKEWQKHFTIVGKNKKELKSLAHSKACEMFPDQEFYTPKGRVLDGRSDSALISEYGRRKLMGLTMGGVQNAGKSKSPKRKITPRH